MLQKVKEVKAKNKKIIEESIWVLCAVTLRKLKILGLIVPIFLNYIARIIRGESMDYFYKHNCCDGLTFEYLCFFSLEGFV
jgi:hypothetical protein